MTVHMHKSHHRPEVRRLPKHSLWRWVASCHDCTFYQPRTFWRQALVAANQHSEELR